jgi:hypothetical protein
MREALLERKACTVIQQFGGLSYKWVSPGHPGVPDRIAVLPENRIVFIEFKKPGLKDGLSVKQWKTISRLQDLGCIVWRIDDLDDLRTKLTGLLSS